ncbi:hypothetical protein JTB14_007868 [Gonioctena quinquepunctata]|nr:hypothetical protein JTB14_007868 [Gonioctena quinquepunctata]
MGALVRFQKEYPGLAKFWFGPRLCYCISDPEHIQKILTNTKNLEKDDSYRFLSDSLGTGLLTAPVPKWKKHRKAINPAFNQKILDLYVEIFARQSEILKDQLKNYIGKKNSDLYLPLYNCTLDMICETAMGVQMHIQTSDSTFGTNLDRTMEIITYRIFRFWHHFLAFTWKLYPLSREYARLVTELRNTISLLIKKKIEEYDVKKKVQGDSVVAEIEEGMK